MQKIICQLPRHSITYEIEIGSGLAHQQSQYLNSLSSKFAIISDENVANLYGQSFIDSFRFSASEIHLFSFPAGENSKTRSMKEILENQMLEKGFGRDTCVIALGGGIATDLAGFIAATYCRGIPLVTIPTSLVGMVDASIGGKTAINTPFGKNLIGAIYQPKKVVIDPLFLTTLSKKDLSNGFVEMIKHGMVADQILFENLENNSEHFFKLNLPFIETMIAKNCSIKKEIVEQDEFERGKRHLLNFGHTVGHALEKLTNYALSHGEAVGIGLMVESRLSLELGFIDQNLFERIKAVLIRYGLSFELPFKISTPKILEAMILDKKSINGLPRFVMIDGIESPVSFNCDYCTHVEENILVKVLDWMNDDLCCY